MIAFVLRRGSVKTVSQHALDGVGKQSASNPSRHLPLLRVCPRGVAIGLICARRSLNTACFNIWFSCPINNWSVRSTGDSLAL